jgi:[acyl-carrier-protein] S-malonyltransferase
MMSGLNQPPRQLTLSFHLLWRRIYGELKMKTIAFVFPGQGSQKLGMLGELATRYSEVQETFREASSVLDYDLWALTQQGPIEQLNETAFTQPALLAAGVACWQIWLNSKKNLPSVLAGHSLGEYTALVCAGSLDFKDAILLVKKRGEFMQAAVPRGQGGMAAVIGLELETIEAVCNEAAEGQVLAPANMNSPGQIVIAGEADAINRAILLAKEKGAKMAISLPVSVPSHCDLMRPAAERLATVMTNIQFKSPQIPIYHNVDVQTHQNGDEIKQALIEQLYSPVRWIETIQTFATLEVGTIVECGPGTVLGSLNKRIAQNIENFSMSDLASLNKILTIGV